MKSHLTKVSLALLSTVFLLGCQEPGSGPLGPEGLGPEFKKCDSPPCNGGGGSATVNLDLTDGMTSTATFVVDVAQDSDTKLTVSNGELDLEIQMSFTQPTRAEAKGGDCTVIFGSNGDHDEGLTNREWDGLLAELIASRTRSGIWMKIDKGALGSPSDGNLLQVVRHGTFDNDLTGGTSIMLGSPFSQVEPATVTGGGGPDVFVFTGPVVVAANGVGRKGKRGRRTIACGGAGDNTVTATVDRSTT